MPSAFPFLGGLAMLYFGLKIAQEGYQQFALFTGALGMASLALSFFV